MKLESNSKHFNYSDKQKEHLSNNDPLLKEVIEKVGHICREVEPNIFSSLVRSIIGQQISTAAQKTIYSRLLELVKEISVQTIFSLEQNELQQIGISNRKALYIKELATKVVNKEIDLESLRTKSDDDVIKELISLKGIGIWTAEMTLIFSLQREDIVSYGDLAIRRGMEKLYKIEKITKKQFDSYRKRYSPYGSVASLYLWAVASGKWGY
ncbi:MAG: DNA-3-methyladenine glycosylase family protein [Sphaerochaetaceae bacterium]